jgi:hypothetical protein
LNITWHIVSTFEEFTIGISSLKDYDHKYFKQSQSLKIAHDTKAKKHDTMFLGFPEIVAKSCKFQFII